MRKLWVQNPSLLLLESFQHRFSHWLKQSYWNRADTVEGNNATDHCSVFDILMGRLYLSYDGVLVYLMIYLVLIFRFHYNKAYIPQKVRCGTGSQCQGNRMTGRHRWGHQRKSDKLRLLIQIEPGHGIRRGSVLPLILTPFALNVNPCKSMIKTGNSRLLQNIINLWKNEVRLKHVAWIKITGFVGIVFYL